MASSLIRINEATAAELQNLKGIGPARARYIEQYRQLVAPITTTVDLSAATGLGIRSAEALANHIDWQTDERTTASARPVLVILAASLLLITAGFNGLTEEPFVPPASYFHLCLAAILLGVLSAAGDMAVCAIRRQPSETSWIFPAAATLCITGLVMLLLLTGSQWFVDYDPDFLVTLNNTSVFIFFILVIAYLLYGPGLLLRFCLGDAPAFNLATLQFTYHASLGGIAVCAGVLLLLKLTNTWIEEIFSLWALAITAAASRELLKGRSPFFLALTELDQERVKFAWRRQFGESRGTSVALLARFVTASTVFLGITFATSVLRTLAVLFG